jgi:hypothetical protein
VTGVDDLQRTLIAESRAALAEDRLSRARAALAATGYFTDDEVGEDVAPRVTELWAAVQAGQTTAALPAAVVAEPGSRLLICMARDDLPKSTLTMLHDRVTARWPDHEVSIICAVNAVVVAPPSGDPA